MRTAQFISPSHPGKICDVVVESISVLYYTSNQIYHSDIFAFNEGHVITVVGTIIANNHFTDNEIISFVKTNLDDDVIINLNVSKISQPLELQSRIFSGTYLGYANKENESELPFEYLRSKELTRLIYFEYKIPLSVQVNINGITNNIYLEHNSTYKNQIDTIVHEYMTGSNVTIVHNNLYLGNPFRSGQYQVQNLYGPRTSYGNTDFTGMELITNKRLAHLISRKWASSMVQKHRLAYCMVELSYACDTAIPFQIGIKGNEHGIFLENGTFFKYGEPDEYLLIEESIINDIAVGSFDTIQSTKWGIL